MMTMRNKLLVLLIIIIAFSMFGCKRKPNVKGDTPSVRHKINRSVTNCANGVCPLN